MIIDEALYEIDNMIGRCYYKRDIEALTMARKALRTMRDMKEAEDINKVVEILQDYMSEVEI